MVPFATAVASPTALMVATAVVVDVHVTELLKFCLLPSLYVPVAVNCCVVPAEMDAFAGVTAIDTSVGGVTVNVVDPLIDPDVAWIMVFPCDTLVANPVPFIVAALVFEEDHNAELVKFCLLPSLYVPVAVHCCVVPAGTDAFAGVTAIDTSVGGVIVNVVDPLIDPDVAWIVVFPCDTLVANPVPFIVAALAFEEDHNAELVKFCLLPSVYVPIAVNCCVVPAGTDGFAGVTAIDTSVGGVTVNVVDPPIEPSVAWIVALPVDIPVANPAPFMVATLVFEEDHDAELVVFCVLPSVYVAVAVNC